MPYELTCRVPTMLMIFLLLNWMLPDEKRQNRCIDAMFEALRIIFVKIVGNFDVVLLNKMKFRFGFRKNSFYL